MVYTVAVNIFSVVSIFRGRLHGYDASRSLPAGVLPEESLPGGVLAGRRIHIEIFTPYVTWHPRRETIHRFFL